MNSRALSVVKWLVLAAVTAIWAVLFYANYWHAAIPAFGDVSGHLARLRAVLWNYAAAGTAIAAGWVVMLAGRRKERLEETARPEKERVLGE
jgi:hypothetical protein